MRLTRLPETLPPMNTPVDGSEVTQELMLQLQGMTCSSCSARVEKALLKVAGVSSATVNLATQQAFVRGLDSLERSSLVAAVDTAFAVEGFLDFGWALEKVLGCFARGTTASDD